MGIFIVINLIRVVGHRSMNWLWQRDGRSKRFKLIRTKNTPTTGRAVGDCPAPGAKSLQSCSRDALPRPLIIDAAAF